MWEIFFGFCFLCKRFCDRFCVGDCGKSHVAMEEMTRQSFYGIIRNDVRLRGLFFNDSLIVLKILEK
jgi:hypothetical protein